MLTENVGRPCEVEGFSHSIPRSHSKVRGARSSRMPKSYFLVFVTATLWTYDRNGSSANVCVSLEKKNAKNRHPAKLPT